MATAGSRCLLVSQVVYNAKRRSVPAVVGQNFTAGMESSDWPDWHIQRLEIVIRAITIVTITAT